MEMYRQALLAVPILHFITSVMCEHGSGPVLLTPYWEHLRFAEGETVSIDCGVFIRDADTSIEWLDGSGNVLPDNNARISVKSGDEATTNSSYTVTTLTIMELTLHDSQTYTCQTGIGNGTIAVNVLPRDKWYGFEGEGFSGWKTSNTSHCQWHVHNTQNPVYVSKLDSLKFDHTYGPSKYAGHFLDLDLSEQQMSNLESHEVELLSPSYAPSNTTQCLHYWYINNGDDIDEFSVSVQGSSSSQVIEPSNVWKLGKFEIAEQSKEFQILFRVNICKDNCTVATINGVVALDDIAVTEGPCSNEAFQWPTTGDVKVHLKDGKTTCNGQVEVLHDGQYGAVCFTGITTNDAKVICNQLDLIYKDNTPWKPTDLMANTTVWINRLACEGSETPITQCLTHNQTSTACNQGVHLTCAAKNPGKDTCKPLATKPNPASKPPLTSTTPSSTTKSTAKTTSPVPSSLKPVPSSPKSTSPATTIKPSTTPSTTTSTVVPGNTTIRTSAAVTTLSKSTSTATTTTVTTSSLKPSSLSTLSTTEKVSPANNTNTQTDGPDTKKPSVSKATRIGGGVVVGIVAIVVLGLVIFAVLVYKGRKRRLRKSKYLNFGTASYSREHLPTNEFHLESPLTMSSMGYTVLA